jgi:threonyl-tRNA synthetase
MMRMPLTLTLPDGSQRRFDQPLTVREAAAAIGAGLAKAALAGRVNGRLVDCAYLIDQDAHLAIITDKDPEGLELIRHSSAHLLAYAVKTLFPEAQVTIGPVIENGFYYDFAFHRAFTPEDLAAIEAQMRTLAAQDIPIQREEWSRDRAVSFFQSIGEHYKAELIAAIPDTEAIGLYREGDFIDLCRGPHVPSTGRLKAFKLTKLAGAYWRGDSKNAQLQRIYGTAWPNQKDLDAYLHMLAEAEKRDHRRLGRQLDFFHLQEEAPGLIFWHPKGWTLWQEIEQYMRKVYRDNGYQEVRCPQILDRTLWEKSGHWEHFKDNMFTTESENREYAVKPMNCPGHIQLFNTTVRSYRDLPLRYGEFGSCHRNEPSGALHGVMRVRGFTQDDGHIFCTEAQILEEVAHFNALVKKVYADFGFHDMAVKLALRPPHRVGDDSLWDKAEEALRCALRSSALHWDELPGEGAFYGPKIEFHIRDAIGRSWQCGTMQVDFSMPGRLGAEYVTENNTRATPVMLHRAILGSLERFIGILIENHAGALPLWLSPVQAVVLNITDEQADYAERLAADLRKTGLRVDADLRREKINYKIREHAVLKCPYCLVVGDKEMRSGEVSVRARGGKDLGSWPLPDLKARLLAEIASRSA